MKLSQVTYQQAEGDVYYGASASLAQPIHWRIELSEWLTKLGVSWDGNLNDIQELDLGSNQITSIPESIGGLTNLQKLGLGSNQLSSIPASIERLTNLQYLDIDDNPLTDLSPLQRLHHEYFHPAFQRLCLR